jgi:hypothetical protein
VGVAIRGVAFALVLASSLPFSAQAQTCVPDPTPDWMASTGSSAPVRPSDCASVEQTPPDISWPDLSSDAQYQVTLTYPDGSTKSRTAPQNWINWDEVLLPGNYTWRVQASNASAVQDSKSRRFTVKADAVPFLVPFWRVLFNRAVAKPHPRALPDSATLQTMISQRQTEFALLAAQVDSQLADPVPAEPPSTSSIATITEQARQECRRTLEAALAWQVTSIDAYLNDAVRRALNLASWDPRGSTSYASADEAAREIAWTLTLVYDWLYSRLDADQKNLLLAPIATRAADMYYDLIGSRARIATNPYDSHGNQALTYLAGITVLLAGDVLDAEGGLRDALPLALHWTSPWGREDGGFGNGTGYSFWDAGGDLVLWYTLRWVVGVDIAQKAWVRNWGQFTTYFVPPGTPVGAFGDGAEVFQQDNWASYGKSYTLFAPGSLGRWYASQFTLLDPRRLEWLLAPPAADSSPALYPEGTPSAAYFPSIGWAALHSSLQDPARVSVYFKSSFYGSYNHSHADQNSFVVNAGGQRLAIDSGYYDAYGSPHWLQWYKQTRAHNAITFDGGKGQVVFEETGQHFPGAITYFEHHPGYDIVTGDATTAYGGALQEARRSLVYLRPNLVVVHDRLASDVARQWEWNIHALNFINAVSDRKISIQSNGQSLCVDMLAGPTMHFAQTDLFTADPLSGGFRQWHGKFQSVDLLGAAQFIALLNVGCTAVTASASQTGGVWTVPVGDITVIIAADGSITVDTSRDTTPPTVSVTSPAPGATVSGTLTMTASASDNIEVAGVQFQYNGINFDTEVTTAPYSVTGHTTGFANGLYTLTAVARDAAGNRTTSAPVTITVSNP